jgi:hypothetical protein
MKEIVREHRHRREDIRETGCTETTLRRGSGRVYGKKDAIFPIQFSVNE